MTPADQVVRDFFRSWKRNDPDEVAAFFASDATYTDGPRGTHRGRKAIRQEVAVVSERFPVGFDVAVQSLKRPHCYGRAHRPLRGGQPFL